MTNQQLKAHCDDVIANPQEHLDWVVDMARVTLASLEAEPVAYSWRSFKNKQLTRCPPEQWKSPREIKPLYESPPVPEMKPIELPHKLVAYVDTGELVTEIDDENGTYMEAAEVIDFIRAAGYEVKS